jgi:hypothetical protein
LQKRKIKILESCVNPNPIPYNDTSKSFRSGRIVKINKNSISKNTDNKSIKSIKKDNSDLYFLTQDRIEGTKQKKISNGLRHSEINNLAYIGGKNPILEIAGSGGKRSGQFMGEFKTQEYHHKASISNTRGKAKQIFPPLKRRY